MSLPRYPEYKDSGIRWLGEVPAHWEVVPLKHSFQIVGGSTPKSEKPEYWDGSIVWVSPADLSKLTSIYIDDSARKITDERWLHGTVRHDKVIYLARFISCS